MLEVINSTAMCVPMAPKPLRPPNITTVALHRLSLATSTMANPDPVPDDELDGTAIARAFADQQLRTGGDTPYHVLVRADGRVEQLLPLLVCGAHAVAHNWRSWGVAVAGNYDEVELPDRLWRVVVQTCATLALLTRSVNGHTELPGASSDPNKRCPGQYINMDWVRTAVTKKLPLVSMDIRDRLALIVEAGYTL